MTVQLDRTTFDDCFKPALALHPFKRDRDWQGELGRVYHQHLGGYREVQLSEALHGLIDSQSDFPTIAQVRAEIARRCNSAHATSRQPQTDFENLIKAIRILESRFGKPTQLTSAPAWMINCVDKAVELGRAEAEKHVEEGLQTPDLDDLAERYALGTLNVLIRRHPKNEGR